MIHVLIVGLTEWPGLDGVVDRENRMALLDAGVIDDRHHRFDTTFWNFEDAPKVVLHVIAGNEIGGNSSSGSRNGSEAGVTVRWNRVRLTHMHRPEVWKIKIMTPKFTYVQRRCATLEQELGWAYFTSRKPTGETPAQLFDLAMTKRSMQQGVR
jgi:hypothetical protein